MGELPYQTVIVKETFLTEHAGKLAKLLHDMLVACKVSPRIPVRMYEYSAGRIPLKYRVSIELPREIGSGPFLPYGIARSSLVAFETALLEAIVVVRDEMHNTLGSTAYVAIPRGTHGEIEKMNYAAYVQDHPEAAATYLENCELLLDMIFSLHSNLVVEVEQLVDEFTDDDMVRERRVMMHDEFMHQHGEESGESSETDQESGVVVNEKPISPIWEPETPTPCESVGESRPEYVANSSHWEWPILSEPIIPSGWGTDDESIPCFDMGNGAGVDNYPEFYAFCREALETCGGTEVINISDSDVDMTPIGCYYTEEGHPFYPEIKEENSLYGVDDAGGMQIFSTGEKFEKVGDAFQYIDSFFAMGEMKLESTSEPEVVTPLAVAYPDTVRRTSRAHGWTPGKYYESD